MWTETTEERYREMMDILPPALWECDGFLVGEPWVHRDCKVTGAFRAAYAAFVKINGKHYECSEAMTKPEFRAINPLDVITAKKGKPEKSKKDEIS
jgi:hypothetical protein